MALNKQGLKIQSLTFKYHDIKVHVSIKARQKHSYLRVKNSSVHISTSSRREGFYREFIDSRLEWIQKQLNSNININQYEEFYLFGKVSSFPHQLQKQIDSNLARREQYKDTYHKEQTRLHVKHLYDKYSVQMGLYATKISYRKMKRRWGSCNAKGELTFNALLSRLPLELMEYVVVHELSHLKHMNHSKAFHLHVKRYLENEKELRNQFKEYSVL